MTTTDDPSWRERVRAALRHDSVLWRRAMQAGVDHGPEAFVRHSPTFFGLLFGAALPDHRRAVLRNLRSIYGERSKRRELVDVAATFTAYAHCLTEAFLAARDPSLLRLAKVSGREHFIGAQEAGKGIVIATAHTGGWQAAGPLLHNLRAVDIVVVMQREPDEAARALQDEARDRAGVRVVHIGDDPLEALPLLTHLKRGGAIAAQMDRLPQRMRGRTVELFGAPWRIPEGPLLLSAMTGAPLVPVFTRRVERLAYEIAITPAIRLPRRPNGDALDAAARRIAGDMERFIRDSPTQWFHFVFDKPPRAPAPKTYL